MRKRRGVAGKLRRGLGFLLKHPGLAHISCEECKQWIVDLSKEEFAERQGKRQERRPNQPTPCRKCPKGSPEEAKRFALTDAHWKTLGLYLRSRATFGRSLSDVERFDPILLAHFAAIETTWRQFEKCDAARLVAESIPFTRKGK